MSDNAANVLVFIAVALTRACPNVREGAPKCHDGRAIEYCRHGGEAERMRFGFGAKPCIVVADAPFPSRSLATKRAIPGFALRGHTRKQSAGEATIQHVPPQVCFLRRCQHSRSSYNSALCIDLQSASVGTFLMASNERSMLCRGDRFFSHKGSLPSGHETREPEKFRVTSVRWDRTRGVRDAGSLAFASSVSSL